MRMLASYGSLARFKDVQRLHPVGNNTVIGAGGDMSDFQYVQTILDKLMISEFTAQDDHNLGPAEIHEYLAQVMYARRSKMNPLWNSLIVGGVKDGKKYGRNMYSFCGSADTVLGFLLMLICSGQHTLLQHWQQATALTSPNLCCARL